MLDKIYIIKRKIKATGVAFTYIIMRIFPVKTQRIVFTTFEGNGGYSCNPRYIAEELLRENHDYEIIWLINDIKKEFPSDIKKIKNTFLNRVYFLSTSKVWIDNTRKEYGTMKRKNQFYIQTWHASIGFKAVGGFRKDKMPLIAQLVSKHDSNLIDYVISNSKWTDEHIPTKLFYKGEIIKTGSPRCDVLVNEVEKSRQYIRKKYNVAQDNKILLYAPTFKGGSQNGNRSIYSEEQNIELDKIQLELSSKFGGEWVVMTRLHPQLATKMNKMEVNDICTVIDVSQHDDMNELIAASDALITDYSSSAFDAIVAKLPVFLYVPDKNEYIRERGDLMWNIDSFIFTVSGTNNELMEQVSNFHEQSYLQDLQEFSEIYEIMEDGNASKRIAALINKIIIGEYGV